MNIKELRIGNIVDTDKGVGTVIKVCEYKNTEPTVEVNIHPFEIWGYKNPKIKKIELTKDILTKWFGFTTVDGVCFEFEGIEIWYDGTGFYHINSKLLTHIDSVHFLQNWYFFNTDEELELKIKELQ